MFCEIMTGPSFNIANFMIISAIRNKIASRLDIDSLRKVLALHWKPYLENLHVCMTDANCNENPYAFSYEHEVPLGKPRMTLQAYLPSLQSFGHKTSAQQRCGCDRVLSVLLQEKEEEGFMDKDA